MKLVTSRMIDEMIVKAGESPRFRTNYNIHESLSDPVQRLFIAAEPSPYFRPHRHAGTREHAVIVRGRFGLLIFDPNCKVTSRIRAGRGGDIVCLEIPADVYHTWIPMEEGSVFFEVKKGPYDPAAPASFAPWSPAEGTAPVEEFQSRLLRAQTGDCLAP